MPKEKTESLGELEVAKKEIEEQIRQKKRIEAEINLETAVQDMDDVSALLKACYSYIATHRRLV